jgi:cytochrome o ubiquinol oxidase subunit 3
VSTAPARPAINHARRQQEDPHKLGRHGNGNGAQGAGSDEGGPASKRIVAGYGFWIFLLSDIVMFSAFFAAYAVLAKSTAGGPSGRDLFDMTNVAIETALLLASSFTCGLGNLASQRRDMLWTQIWLLATGVLGFAFVLLEIREFADMIAQGAGPQRSAFLSSFYALVGCHGLHVSVGLLWLGTMMAQVWVKGFRPAIQRRLLCFNLFWHALDIVWVGVFTIVYLLGAGL